MSNKTEQMTVELPTVQQLLVRIAALEQQVTDLTKPANSSQKEMTDEDARNILIGSCKDLKHNEAAQKLGLSYGQVYSCRGEYTFRHIHKELKSQTPPFVNPWKKK